MEITVNMLKRNVISTMLVVSTLLALTSGSPVRHQPSMTSEKAWLMSSQGATKSHLVMWMMTEKQLIPQMAGLIDTAFGLFRCTCEKEGKPGMEECLDLAVSLPNITGLHHVPSQDVINSEKKKVFVKMLLENAFQSLVELQTLLWTYVTPEGLGQCEIEQDAKHFMHNLQVVTSQYKDVMTSFYKVKNIKSEAVTVQKEEFSSDRQLAIKLLYIAVNHLNQVSSALEYSVELSWYSRLDTLSKAGRGNSKKKNRRNKVKQ